MAGPGARSPTSHKDFFFFSQVLVPNFHSVLWIQVQCEKTHNSLIKPQEVVGSLLRLRPS